MTRGRWSTSPTSSTWYDVKDHNLNCINITTTECDLTPNVLWGLEREILLRVRAKVEDLVSPWLTVPSFRHCWNVTIGPPENIWVTPGEGSLILRFSSPYATNGSSFHFSYYVRYWEKAGNYQVKGPFRSTFIVLNDLKPLREYCLQVKAHLVCQSQTIVRAGSFSNVTCYQTTMDATTKLQQVIMIAVGLFLLLSMLAGACFFMVLKYRGLVKYWFHSPPSIPLQIEEYLKDPAQPILEALDKDSSPKDDAWDSVSIVSFSENEQEDVLQSTSNQSAGPVQRPGG
ncbi:interferon gamma receptor 2 [Suricata suricatta]|uniref:interferon gamma receptor 2 n=1 Tax=Suricata suricatta TaxID=37032 RepID=UPI001155979A|nr:interferon gamma receptor 2 [Suricata suricatta]